MPDIQSELRELAADAASLARPAPVAEIIGRGNRRRRVLAGEAIALLSVVSVATGALIGATRQPAASAVGPGSGSRTSPAPYSVFVSRAVLPRGTLYVWTKYAVEGGREIAIGAVRASFVPKGGSVAPRALFTFAFTGPGTDGAGPRWSSTPRRPGSGRRLTTRWLPVPAIGHVWYLGAADTLVTTVREAPGAGVRLRRVASMTLTISPGCPPPAGRWDPIPPAPRLGLEPLASCTLDN